MSVSPFDSTLFGDLFGDREIAALFSDKAMIARMIDVERALARAGARAGVVPPDAAAAIDATLADIVIPPEALASGTAGAGVPVPALVAALRGHLAGQAAGWLHWGATSQDIVDTALVLQLASAIDTFAARLDGLIAGLSVAALHHADLPMAGRTRSQIAAPITFGSRIARWAQPLMALRRELAPLRARVARVQLGGAVGTNAVLAPHGPAVTAALADELGLADGPCWHTDRAALIALAGWCASISGALGKMAGDLILMGRSESGEAVAGEGGGSSTMPQKANPVAAETVVALAHLSAALVAPMHLAALHAEERDGAAWALEWLTLPQIVTATGACLRHAADLASTLAPDPDRMRAALALGGGVIMAEVASFVLAATMPRAEAQALVKQAVTAAAAGGETLADALARLAPGRDWPRILDPVGQAPAAAAVVCQVFGAAPEADDD